MATDSLFAQLKHPNPRLRQRAMQELAETRDETTIPRLMNILGESDVVYRRAAVVALGMIGSDTVPPLVETLLTSDNPTTRSSCAKALAQIAVNYPEVSKGYRASKPHSISESSGAYCLRDGPG